MPSYTDNDRWHDAKQISDTLCELLRTHVPNDEKLTAFPYNSMVAHTTTTTKRYLQLEMID